MLTISRRRLLRSVCAGAGLSIAGSLLAACGNSPAPVAPTPTVAAAAQPGSTAAAKPAAAAPTTAPATTSSGPVTLDLWMLHPEWKDAMAKVVTAFQTAHPGITLNVVPQQSATYDQLVQTALNAGTGPDIFQASTRPKLDINADAGQLLDLTSKVDTSSWTQVAKDAYTIKNKIWAVPGGKYTVGLHITSRSSRRLASRTSPRPGRT